MAALATQHIVDTGAAPSFATLASASDTAEVGNGHNTFLVYRNTTAADLVVTITPDGDTGYGEDLPAKVVTVPATTGEKWIPLRREYMGENGRCTITATGTGAGKFVAVVRMS